MKPVRVMSNAKPKLMLHCLLHFLFAAAVFAQEKVRQLYYNQGQFEIVRYLPTFTDRSLLIKYVYPKHITTTESVVAYIAPRRFGKTVNLDMLDKFYGADHDKFGNVLPQNESKYYDVFKDLKIWTEREDFAREHFAKYPVLRIDLSRYKIDPNYTTALQILTLRMYEQHIYLGKSNRLSSMDREEFNHNLRNLKVGEFKSSEGDSLFRWLKLHHGLPVILLVDEMDSISIRLILSSATFGPTEENKLSKLFEYLRSLIKNAGAQFTVFTGITRVGEVASVEINVIQYMSVFDNEKIASFYSFSDDDIKSVAKKMGRLHQVDSMMSYYDGYRIQGSNKTVYNTLSAAASFTTGVVESFWDAGNGLDNIGHLFGYHFFGRLVEESLFAPLQIKIANKVSKNHLLQFKALVSRQNVGTFIHKGVRDIFFQYLLEQGYYTIVNSGKIGKKTFATIEAPNEETREALTDKVYTSEYFEEKYVIDIEGINNYIMSLRTLKATKKSVELLKQSITGLFRNKIPKAEIEVQAALYHIASCFGEHFFKVVRAEKYVKMTKDQMEKIDKNKLKIKSIMKIKKRNKAGGVYIDMLVTEYSRAKKSADKDSEISGDIVKIIECKCNERKRALDALHQILDNEYRRLDENEPDLKKKDIKEKPSMMEYIGISYTTKHSWEVCVLINSDRTEDIICV